MARPFAKLRGLMTEQGVEQSDIARALLLEASAVSKRFCAIRAWRLDEMYTVLELLGQPPERMHELFPPGGQNEPGCRRGKRGDKSA